MTEDALSFLDDNPQPAEAAPVALQEPEVEGQGEDTAAPPAAQEPHKDVPLTALLDEREKRQQAAREADELRRELAALRAQAQPQPRPTSRPLAPAGHKPAPAATAWSASSTLAPANGAPTWPAPTTPTTTRPSNAWPNGSSNSRTPPFPPQPPSALPSPNRVASSPSNAVSRSRHGPISNSASRPRPDTRPEPHAAFPPSRFSSPCHSSSPPCSASAAPDNPP